MSSTLRHGLAIVPLAVLVTSTVASSQSVERGQSTPRYFPIDLGVERGGTHLRAVDVNDKHQVAGTLIGADGLEAFVWLPKPDLGLPAGISRLGTMPLGDSNASRASAIDDCGRIVGTASGNTPGTVTVSRAFLWADGRMNDLGTLAGRATGATGINANGVVVGWSTIAPRTTLRAFSTSVRCGQPPDGRLIDLGALGGTFSVAHAINARDQVVGSTSFPVPPASTIGVAFVQDARDGMVALPTPPVPPLPITSFSGANAINDRGVVAGSVTVNDGTLVTERALLWRKSGSAWSFQELGPIEGRTRIYPTSLDEQSRVVVIAQAADPADTRAYLWVDGTYHALDDLLATPLSARITHAGGMNGHGDIAASGYNARGEFRPFLLLRIR